MSAEEAPPIFAAALKLRRARCNADAEDIAAARIVGVAGGQCRESAGIAVPLFNRQHKLVGAMLLLRAKAADPALISFIEAFSDWRPRRWSARTDPCAESAV